MAIIESKVQGGTLTLGTSPGTDFSCQVTNIRVNTAYSDDGDSVEALCGDMLSPGRKVDSRSLAGTFIQDFTAPAATSLTKYLRIHELETVDFEYVPNAEAETITGQLKIEQPAESYGGEVNTRLTSDFEWFIQGDPVYTEPVGTFEAMTVDELKAQAAEQGLPTSGTKAELVARLSGVELVDA